jgi:undecaprenyl-diphosphatase
MRAGNHWQKTLQDLDARLTRRFRIAEKPGLLRSLAASLAHSGDSWLWAAGLALVWLIGSPDWHWRSLYLFISIILLAALVLLVKFSVRRRRPEGEWGSIYRSTDPHSFPSGHAARAAMLAVLGIGLGPAWFGVALLVWAPLVSLARVAMGLHYVSDVVAGVILGILAGFVALLFRQV